MKDRNPTTPENDAFAMVLSAELKPKALAILRCLYGSEIALLRVVISNCETPTTNISQENGHGILTQLTFLR